MLYTRPHIGCQIYFKAQTVLRLRNILNNWALGLLLLGPTSNTIFYVFSIRLCALWFFSESLQYEAGEFFYQIGFLKIFRGDFFSVHQVETASEQWIFPDKNNEHLSACLLYTSDAADE